MNDTKQSVSLDETSEAQSKVYATLKFRSGTKLAVGQVIADLNVGGSRCHAVAYDDDNMVAIMMGRPPAPVTPVTSVGSSSLIATIDGTDVRAGLCAIIGMGGVGKTPVAHAMARACSPETEGGSRNYGIIRFGEPFAGYISDSRDLCPALLLAIVENVGQAVVLDSVKDLLSGGGSAMKSGLSREALMALTRISIACANVGTVVFTPVNPSSDDADVIALLTEAARSNCSAVMLRVNETRWSVISRSVEGGRRHQGHVSVEWSDKEGFEAATISGVHRVKPGQPVKSRPFSAELPIETLSASITRSLSESFIIEE